MNLEKLKQRNAGNILPVQLDPETTVHLRKMTAADAISIAKAAKGAGHVDPDGPEPSEAVYLQFHALILSKTIAEQDESGNWRLTLDSDEGREQLALLKFEDAELLSVKAQEWSGLLTPAKKNSADSSGSPSS